MIIKLNITCGSCGSGDVIIEGNNILICKNIKCDDFDCFWDLNAKYLFRNFERIATIEEGLTGELTYETMEGKFHETYSNGRITDCKKL